MANPNCCHGKTASKKSLLLLVLLAVSCHAFKNMVHLCFLKLFAIISPRLEFKTNITSAEDFEKKWLLFSELEEGRYDAIVKANKVPTEIPNEEVWLLSKPNYDREAHYRRHGQLIPKTLHKVFLSTTGTYSRLVENVLLELNSTRTANYVEPSPTVGGEKRLTYAHISWKKYNPRYEIRYLNLHQCRSYLEQNFHPLFLRVFDCIEAFSGKTNFMRYLLVYREGGFYSDWKQECRKEGLLDWLSDDNTTWFSANDDGLDGKAMQTNFFGATPRSPVMIEAIRFTLHNAQTRLDLNPKSSPYDMSGPKVLWKAFKKAGVKETSGVRLGQYRAQWGMRMFYQDEEILVHKCWGCGKNQSWTQGNNYIEKHALGEYFCPDAPSLF